MRKRSSSAPTGWIRESRAVIMEPMALFRTLFIENPNGGRKGDTARLWRIARIVVFAVFVAANVVFVCFHEPWQDEAQAWLLVSNLDFPSLMGQLKIEGHPALWYLILYPFVKLGCAIGVMGFISLALVAAAAWLLLRRSPFPPAVQVLLLTSPLFTYYLPVISRSYALALLLIVVAACLHRNRRAHMIAYGLVAALMFQTHVILAGLAFGMVMLMAVDALRARATSTKIWGLTGIAIALLGLLAAYLELRGGPSSGATGAVFAQIAADPLNVVYRLCYDYIANIGSLENLSNGVKVVVALASVAAVIVPLITNPRRYWRPVTLVVMGIGAQLVISVFIHPSGAQRSIFFMAMFMLEGWLILDGEASDGRGAPAVASALVLLILYCFCTIPYTLKVGISDIQEPYSGSTDMGSYLEREVPLGTTIVSGCASATEAVIPYAPTCTYWNPSADVEFTYCDWGNTWDETAIWNQVLSLDQMVARYRTAYPDATMMYLLADVHMPETSEMAPYLLYAQGDVLDGEESFRLYRIPV